MEATSFPTKARDNIDIFASRVILGLPKWSGPLSHAWARRNGKSMAGVVQGLISGRVLYQVHHVETVHNIDFYATSQTLYLEQNLIGENRGLVVVP